MITSQIHEFIRQFKEYSGNPNITSIDFLKEEHSALLDTHLLQDSLNAHPDDILILYHMELNIDNDDDSIHRLLSIINGNRENYVQHNGVILFVFATWFIQAVYSKAPDFYSCISFHADFSSQAKPKEKPLSKPISQYEYFFPIRKKDSLRASISNEKLIASARLQSCIDYLTLLRQHYLKDEESIKIISKVLETYEEKARFESKILELYLALSSYYSTMNQYDLASIYSRKAASMSIPLTSAPMEQIIFYNKKAYAYIKDYQLDKAREMCHKAIAISQQSKLNESSEIARTYNYIGAIFYNMSDYFKALEYFEQTLCLLEKIVGTEHPNSASIYNDIGGVYGIMGNYSKALEYHEKALAIRENTTGSMHPDVSVSYNCIGNVYCDFGEYPKALEFYEKALHIQEKEEWIEHPDTAIYYDNIGSLFFDLGEYPKALKYYKKAFAIRENALGPRHSDTAACHNNIGATYNALGKYKDAIKHHFNALSMRESILGNNHPDTEDSYKCLKDDFQKYQKSGGKISSLDKSIVSKLEHLNILPESNL